MLGAHAILLVQSCCGSFAMCYESSKSKAKPCVLPQILMSVLKQGIKALQFEEGCAVLNMFAIQTKCLWFDPLLLCSLSDEIIIEPRYEKTHLYPPDCTSTQSDQRLCCSLPRQAFTYSCYIQKFRTLTFFTSLFHI